MDNPWVNLPKVAPLVLPEDKTLIDDYNASRGITNPSYIHLEQPPEPFIGNPDAPIVLLNLNPGYSPETNASFDTNSSYFQGTILGNLAHTLKDYPFYLLDPQSGGSGGYKWWYDRLRTLINECGEDGQRKVAQNILCIELFGYHTTKWHYKIPEVPSQQYGFYLVRQAMDRGALIIVMRKRWLTSPLVLKYLPGLNGYEALYTLNATMAMFITPNNCPAGYPKALEILKQISV